MTPEHVRRMIACAPLLPPPGDGVVKELAQAYLNLYAEHEKLLKTTQDAEKTTEVTDTQ